MANNIVHVIDPGHSTQHYRAQETSRPGLTAAELSYITRLLIQVLRHAGTLYLSFKKMPLLPCLTPNQALKKFQVLMMFIFFCTFFKGTDATVLPWD